MVTPKNLVGTVEWPVLLVVTGAIAMEQALWAFVIIGQETPSFLEMLGKFLRYENPQISILRIYQNIFRTAGALVVITVRGVFNGYYPSTHPLQHFTQRPSSPF